MSPKLSIVLPVYNGEHFVVGAVSSIYGQTYLPTSFEIILIDDGSSDRSLEVCQGLAADYKEIRLLHHDVNRGIAATRNLGIKRAQGEFLALLDQDDAWRPEKLAHQFNVLEENTSVEFVLGMQEFHLIGTEQFPRWFKPEWAHAPQPGYVFGCLLIRKESFLKVGLLDEGLLYGSDDVDWFGRAKSLGICEMLLPEVVLDRKIHSSNTSSKTQPFNAELLKVIRRKIART